MPIDASSGRWYSSQSNHIMTKFIGNGEVNCLTRCLVYQNENKFGFEWRLKRRYLFLANAAAAYERMSNVSI